ncbi:MAG: ABC transporter ATP-binding protein [Agrobacterium cavarae]|uniref:ABC transporter ATP-binding protein n=1 Tax=Agrobacterium cavarae TaxID=2528239 RepID=UPI0031A548C4
MREDTKSGGAILLDAQALSAAYGANVVLDDVSLLVREGQLTVLAGPNGSGKSTLLSLLARILKPAHGAVLLNGRDISTTPSKEIAKKLGLLPQTPLVPERITVYDLVSRGRYPHQGFLKHWSQSDEAAVTQALSATSLADLAGRAVDSLSGGQRQRAFIAMTLAQETSVILLDEPTTFLDLRFQNEVMDMIGRLTGELGRTVVAVLHDLNAAFQYADRIIFMKAGRIHTIVDDLDVCSEELIRDVFETTVTRLSHPATGRPAFLPVPGFRSSP